MLEYSRRTSKASSRGIGVHTCIKTISYTRNANQYRRRGGGRTREEREGSMNRVIFRDATTSGKCPAGPPVPRDETRRDAPCRVVTIRHDTRGTVRRRINTTLAIRKTTCRESARLLRRIRQLAASPTAGYTARESKTRELLCITVAWIPRMTGYGS